jgi:hypothetical protein
MAQSVIWLTVWIAEAFIVYPHLHRSAGGMPMIGYMAAEGRHGSWARLNLIIGSTVAGALLLVALTGSSMLLKPHVDFVLILSLLIALALIDQALKSLPLKEIRLTSGLFLSTIAMLMLFYH